MGEGVSRWRPFVSRLPVKEISRHMKVVYLEQVVETKDPWEELIGMFTIGRELNVEDLIKQRWNEYHAHTALAASVNAIITTDADFARVEELTVHTCNPKALQR
jgi:2-methylcitrate dehydratase PrpD